MKSTKPAIEELEDARPASTPLLTDGKLAHGANEDAALALLARNVATAEILEALADHPTLMKSRKVRLSLASHPDAPRHLSLRLLRQFYTFDLMQFALKPGVAADLKHVADELLVARLDSITAGERFTLARRGSGAIAAALLRDKESRVFHAALDNGRLTEALVVKTLVHPEAKAGFVDAICGHSKWSLRREVQMGLLRNPHTRQSRIREIARKLPSAILRDLLHSSRLPEKNKVLLRQQLKEQS